MSEEKYIEHPERARLNNDQLMLFPEYPKEFLDAFQQLHQEGLLSFDPTQNVNQTHSLQAEIAFFSSLLENNFTIENIKDICCDLQHPYQYDPHKLLYSFTKKRWYSYKRRDSYSREYIETWIQQLQQDRNTTTLRDIIHLATDALFTLSRTEEDSEAQEESESSDSSEDLE
jgi:hypothetical protein